MKTYTITGVLTVAGTAKRPYGYRLELDGVYYSAPVFLEAEKDFSDKIGKEITEITLAGTAFAGDIIRK